MSLLTEITHLQEIMDHLCMQCNDPHTLPPASEQVIMDVKGFDSSSVWNFSQVCLHICYSSYIYKTSVIYYSLLSLHYFKLKRNLFIYMYIYIFKNNLFSEPSKDVENLTSHQRYPELILFLLSAFTPELSEFNRIA